MTVICFKCKNECVDYEFCNIGGDIKPVCTVCSGRKKVMEAVAAVHEARLERAWNNKDTKLDAWLK